MRRKHKCRKHLVKTSRRAFNGERWSRVMSFQSIQTRLEVNRVGEHGADCLRDTDEHQESLQVTSRNVTAIQSNPALDEARRTSNLSLPLECAAGPMAGARRGPEYDPYDNISYGMSLTIWQPIHHPHNTNCRISRQQPRTVRNLYVKYF
jgi:hypothetical protein